jgi:hypothetical protein
MKEACMGTEGQKVIVTTMDELSEMIRAAVLTSLREMPSLQEGGRTGPKRRKFISPKEIEDEFGISRRLLMYWRHEGIGPAYTNFGRRVFYDRAGFEKFAASGQIQTTGLVER